MISGINSSSGITHAYRYNVDTVKERFCAKNEDFLKKFTAHNLQVHEFTENVIRERKRESCMFSELRKPVYSRVDLIDSDRVTNSDLQQKQLNVGLIEIHVHHIVSRSGPQRQFIVQCFTV